MDIPGHNYKDQIPIKRELPPDEKQVLVRESLDWSVFIGGFTQCAFL